MHKASEQGAALLLTFDQARRLLGLKLTTMRSMVRRDLIPHTRIGGRVIFPRAAIDSWLTRLENDAMAALDHKNNEAAALALISSTDDESRREATT